MGSPISQVQSPQTNQPQGKGGQMPAPAQSEQSDGIVRPQGKGGAITYPGQSGQPQMGRPNQYSNTVGPWDNATIQQPIRQNGKGKGA